MKSEEIQQIIDRNAAEQALAAWTWNPEREKVRVSVFGDPRELAPLPEWTWLHGGAVR